MEKKKKYYLMVHYFVTKKKTQTVACMLTKNSFKVTHMGSELSVLSLLLLTLSLGVK